MTRAFKQPQGGNVMQHFGGLARTMRLPMAADPPSLNAGSIDVPLDNGPAPPPTI